MESSGPSKKAIIGLIVIVLLVIAATGAVIATNSNNSKKSNAVASTSPSTSPSSSTSTSPSPSETAYKDGSYSATGTYNSPGGDESIDVNVTLASGTITAVSVTPHANVDEASDYQNQFVSGYKSQVVGKKISDVNLSRVAGSSLTSIGFNSAIDKIESQAKA